MQARKVAVLLSLGLAVVLAGCASQSVKNDSGSSYAGKSDVASAEGLADGGSGNASSGGPSGQSYTGGWGIASDDLVGQFVDRYDELESAAIEELENRKNAIPVHASLGEEVEATRNLAVSVLSVEPGPFDYADGTPTVKVTVSMRNLTDKTLAVKASNWDADSDSGQRLDHKLYIKDEHGRRDVRSFEPTKISPSSTFIGAVYFDGTGLKSVIYERHWLVSSQNQYIYFDLKD